VSSRLIALEQLPLVYLVDWRIPETEIREAVAAFTGEREYAPIDPIVDRLDAALDISGGRMGTLKYLNFPLAEIVLTIWQEEPDLFRARVDFEHRLQALLSKDRAMAKTPLLSDHFAVKLRRDFGSYQIPEPTCGFEQLAAWIYARPSRCPGLRLSYEVFHQLRRNLEDPGQEQDIKDFSHLNCVPYVDLATLDRRMAEYVRRADRSVGGAFGKRVRNDLAEVLDVLESTNTA
jgi:hypothetical protein